MKLNCLFEGTDFKLASCHEPSNDRVAVECGFTSLSIRIVKVGLLISSCSIFMFSFAEEVHMVDSD